MIISSALQLVAALLNIVGPEGGGFLILRNIPGKNGGGAGDDNPLRQRDLTRFDL